MKIEFISRYHKNKFKSYFRIKKTCKLVMRKYYLPILQHNVEAYEPGCDVCLASKLVCHKLYGNPYSFSVSPHCGKNLLMEFVIRLLTLTN